MFNYIRSSFWEVKQKVTWSSSKDIQNKVVVVSVFSVLFSLGISGIDFIVRKAIEIFFSLFF